MEGAGDGAGELQTVTITVCMDIYVQFWKGGEVF
jgi:hypothetical protein